MQCVLTIDTVEGEKMHAVLIDTVEGAEAWCQGYMQCVLTLWSAYDGNSEGVATRMRNCGVQLSE